MPNCRHVPPPHPVTTVLCTGALLLAGLSCATAQDGIHQSDHQGFRVETVVEGLDHPWGLAFLPDGAMLVTERPGRLRIVRDGRLDPQPVRGTPDVWAQGQGGLLDVALHPSHERNGLVYLSYSKPGPRGATTAVLRGRLQGHALTDVEEIFEATAWTDRGVHFGSRLLFDPAGYLFVSVGDRGVMEQAQALSNHQGTVVRLHDDGRVPADNPFIGQSGALPEIFSYGHRNPQGLALHPDLGQIWTVEHGPRGGDELNHVQAGRNYGWPVVTFGINYSGTPISDRTTAPGLEDPLLHWTPSIATSGLTIYRGDRFPAWNGDAFVGALAGQHIARVRLRDGREIERERLLEGLGHRIRDVRTGPDGLLYLLVDARNAPLLRLVPSGS